ncbi:MAG TPA: hypothetical protein VKB88_12585 [Bryobacteraceae bacterium]|nr:hypothetical protein [Bryobacteraceae bacterium]
MPTQRDPTTGEVRPAFLAPQDVKAMTDYPTTAGVGTVGGQLAGTAPALVALGLLPGLAGAGVVGRVVSSPTVQGAVSGAAQNLLTAGEAPDESLLRRGLLGAAFGAPFGYLGGWLGRQFGSDVALSSQQVADAGKTLRAAGVDITSPNLPKAGAPAMAQGAPATVPQAQQVTKALGNIIGVDLPDVTAATLNPLKTTLGQNVGNAAARGSVDASAIINDLAKIETQSGTVPAIKSILDDIRSKIGAGGVISGSDFQNLVRHAGDLDRATSSAVGDIREPAQQIERLLNSGFGQSSPADVVEAYRTARTQYKLLIALENNAKQSGSDLIDPGRLYRNIANSLSDIATTGAGGPNPILDRMANFARAAETTFGGHTPSTTPGAMSPLQWALGGLGLGAGSGAVNYLLHPSQLADVSTYALQHLPGIITAGSAAGGAQLARWLGHLYQNSPAFVNRLLVTGTQPTGINHLLVPGVAAGGTAALSGPVAPPPGAGP